MKTIIAKYMLFIYLYFIKEDWYDFKKYAVYFIKPAWVFRSILVWLLSIVFFPLYLFVMYIPIPNSKIIKIDKIIKNIKNI